MSGGTVVPRHECPGGHFFQGDSHASDTVSSMSVIRNKFKSLRADRVQMFVNKTQEVTAGPFALTRRINI